MLRVIQPYTKILLNSAGSHAFWRMVERGARSSVTNGSNGGGSILSRLSHYLFQGPMRPDSWFRSGCQGHSHHSRSPAHGVITRGHLYKQVGPAQREGAHSVLFKGGRCYDAPRYIAVYQDPTEFSGVACLLAHGRAGCALVRDNIFINFNYNFIF